MISLLNDFLSLAWFLFKHPHYHILLNPTFWLFPHPIWFARHMVILILTFSIISDFISQSSHFTLVPSNPQTQHPFTDSAIRLFSMFLMLFFCPHPSYLHLYLFTTFHLFSFPLLLPFLLLFLFPCHNESIITITPIFLGS